MARIRTVKPEVYRHEKLFELEQATGLPIRLFWIGLFAVCDRDGRFKWRPGSIKLDILPFDSSDVSTILDVLWESGFITRYRTKSDEFGCIPTFRDHQVINAREAQSKLPDPSDQNCEVLTCDNPFTVTHVHAHGEGKGREGRVEGKGTHVRSRVPTRRQESPSGQTPSALFSEPTVSGPHKIIGKYCELFRHRYGDNPPITGHDAGIAKRLLSSVSFEKLSLYLDAYFRMPDAFIVKAKHPLTLFESKLKEIAVFAGSGSFTTSRQASQQDDMASNLILLAKVRGEATDAP